MSSPKLRYSLTELETHSPDLEAEYRKKVEAMLEKRLTPVSRAAWIVAALMGVGFFLVFSRAAILAHSLPGFPCLGQIGFAVGAVFGLIWAVLGAVVVRRGSLSFSPYKSATLDQFLTMSPAAAGITWAFTVIMMVIFLMMGTSVTDGIKGTQMILGGVVGLLMFGIPALVIMHIQRSELRVREHLLRLELQLAERTEKQDIDRECPGKQN
jgi:hypothetical protein